MLQECYKVAVDLRQFVVAGHVLSPLTLNHCRVLDCFGSAFMREEELNLEDIAILVMVCKTNNRKELDELLSGDFSDEITTFALSIAPEISAETVQEITEYFRYYQLAPSRSFGKDIPIERAPWWGRAKAFLCSKCGYTNDEAWDCIVSEAFCEIGFISALNGDETFDTDQTIAIKDLAKQGVKQPSQEELHRMMHGIK